MALLRQQSSKYKSYWIDVLWLSILLGSLFFILLGTRPLFVPDEGRYAEIAREMVISGDYITPYLNHVIYFEKPILFYWLSALAIKIGGINLWAIRSTNAIIGLLGCLITYLTARQLYNRATGLLAAIILGTNTLYFVMLHMISLDLAVSVFLAGSLYAFILGVHSVSVNSTRWYFCASSVAAALAVLTKGLIGIVFPVMIIGIWIALSREWQILKRIPFFACLGIFLLIALPWHILVGQRHPEFYSFYFIEQHFLRYTTKEVGHYQPAWFFIPYFAIGFFPWTAFLPQTMLSLVRGLWNQFRDYQSQLFLLIWALTIFIFFSCSQSKLIPYILPIFPPLSILTANYLQQMLCQKPSLSIKLSFISLIIFIITMMGIFYFYLFITPLPNPTLAGTYLFLAATLLLLGIVASFYYSFSNLLKAIVLTAISMSLFLLLIVASIPSLDTRTILPLAKIIKTVSKPQDDVMSFNEYYQDLPFYLQHRINIVHWHNELTFGMQHQPTDQWMIDYDIFWQRWQSQKRVFVILSKDDYPYFFGSVNNPRPHILGSTLTNILISNRETAPSY